MESNQVEAMSQSEFDRVLLDIIKEMTAEQLLSYPGVYEIIAEELNNEVIERWESEQD